MHRLQSEDGQCSRAASGRGSTADGIRLSALVGARGRVCSDPVPSDTDLTAPEDVHWEDPRTEDEIMSAKRAAAGESFDGNWDDVDVSYTVSSDGVEIKFENPLEVVQWSQDGRLRDFEAQFFANGGKLNAVVSDEALGENGETTTLTYRSICRASDRWALSRSHTRKGPTACWLLGVLAKISVVMTCQGHGVIIL